MEVFPVDLFCQLGKDPQCVKYYWDSGILNGVIWNFEKQSINGIFIEFFDIQFKVDMLVKKYGFIFSYDVKGSI